MPINLLVKVRNGNQVLVQVGEKVLYGGSSPSLTTNPQPTLVGANSGEGGVHI